MSLPLADKLPNPHDVVASSYKFAEQVLTNQKKFADEVLEVTSPLLPGESRSTSAPKSATARVNVARQELARCESDPQCAAAPESRSCRAL